MVKANPIIEAFGLEDRFYADMDIVFVKMPSSNKVEKHYYKATPEGTIKIYDTEKEGMKNPVIKTTGVSIDSKNKRNIYKWRYGSPFVTQLFSNESMDKSVITDQDINSVFDLGREFERLFINKETPTTSSGLTMIQILGLLAALAFAYFWYTGQIDIGSLVSGLTPKGG